MILNEGTYNIWYDIKPNEPMNINHLTVCKEMTDGKLNC